MKYLYIIDKNKDRVGGLRRKSLMKHFQTIFSLYGYKLVLIWKNDCVFEIYLIKKNDVLSKFNIIFHNFNVM